MYSDVFCRVYNILGWNYYPEAFAEQLMLWMRQNGVKVETALDLGCGTGILCRILKEQGIAARGMDFSEGMIQIARENGPGIPFDVADMVTYCPEESFDLVTCTGDALNHIMRLEDVERIFRNAQRYVKPGGYLVFDILDPGEVSDGEPFEMDYDEKLHVWFQMTRPTEDTVNLKIRVSENGTLAFEENIRERVYDPSVICRMMEDCGFCIVKCGDSLPDGVDTHGTTCFVVARKN